MPTQLYAGSLDDFNDSMAKAIEDALADLLGPLPAAPPKLVVNRYIPSQLYWVLASGRLVPAREAETAVVNWVACSIAGPISVGTNKRNAASTRVPAIGAYQISMSRCSIRYLIANRPGRCPAIGRYATLQTTTGP